MSLPFLSVNFHLWQPCNMHCGFCFARFLDVRQDVLPDGHLEERECLRVTEMLAEAGFAKVNFAGGEPTLCPWLPSLVHRAKELGMSTSIVTNGSRVVADGLLESVGGSLNWLAVSVDSTDRETLRRIGRATPDGPMSEDDYARILLKAAQLGIRTKINTVVCSENWQDDMRAFILRVRPERWKLLQALPIEGQNGGARCKFLIDRSRFAAYVERHRDVEAHGVKVVAEDNSLMTASYLMIDPAGRFFDNAQGRHSYSDRILDVGVEAALKQISVSTETFEQRGGKYDW